MTEWDPCPALGERGEGGVEGERVGEREKGREKGREGGREGGTEGRREGGRKREEGEGRIEILLTHSLTYSHNTYNILQPSIVT